MNRNNVGDWGIRAGALALAVLVWFHAVTEFRYEKRVNIWLKVENPPPNPVSPGTIVANLLPERVRALVSGRGKDLLGLNEHDLLLRVRPDGVPGVSRSYPLTPDAVENRNPQAGVEVLEIEPAEILVVLDRRETRKVPVRADVDLQIAPQYTRVGPIRFQPREVEVVGPGVQLQQVQYVEAERLVRTDVREDVEEQLPLRSLRGTRLELRPKHVTVSADIQYLAEDDKLNVPVEVRHAPDPAVVAEPARVKVKVKGGYDVIAYLDPQQDLRLYVDYRDYHGAALPVLAESDSLFEVRSIVPAHVDVVEP